MKRIALIMLTLTLAVVVNAAEKFGYDELRMFRARSVHGVRSMNDGLHYTAKDGNNITKYSYQTGEAVETIFKGGDFAFSGYDFSADETKVLLTTDVESIYRHSFTAEYYILDLTTGERSKLSDGGAQQVASFSPDGKKVAFVRDNNMFWYDVASHKETQITTDGKFGEILNGIPDWVYEEEYSFAQAYQWSAASDAIAFYRTDETRVKKYDMNVFNSDLYPTVYSFKYPKAGEENSIVEIYTYRLDSGMTIKMDIGSETDQYIPRIKWNAKGDDLVIFRINRDQNNFDMLLANGSTGESKVVYNEKNDRYIERIDDQTITFLEDGDRFVLRSEKDGFMHLYLHSLTKGELGRITTGEWEVTDILGVSNSDKVYFISTETSPLRRNLYSINLDGSDKKRMTDGEGTYRAIFSKGHKYYIQYFSNATTPMVVTLHSEDGELVRTLEDNARLKETLAKFDPPTKEFFTFTTSEGITLNGYMIKPHGFDPEKEYAVFMTQYSGPGSQSVSDSWSMSWESVLVQEGYIVACVDGRGTGFRGEDFKKCTYKDLGNLEVKDQIEAGRYLGSLPYVDASRIAIYGWSYGGFMALNCILKGNDVFSTAISVAPVTTWRYYDTIYTELYNGLPQENPEGYDNNSPINFAHMLKGKLLLAHGTGDDNVHVQNSMDMISALVKEGKEFDMAIYPDQNHGMGRMRDNLMHKCIAFIKENL